MVAHSCPEVVGDDQEFYAPVVGQTVVDEIHSPDLIDALGQLQWHALRGWPLDLLAPARGKVGLTLWCMLALVELRSRAGIDSKKILPPADCPKSRRGDQP